MRAIGTDLRHAVRALQRSPGHTLLTVAVLALGLGAVTFATAFLRGTLLRPLPFPQPDQLVQVVEFRTDGDPEAYMAMSPPDFTDLRGSVRSLAAIAEFYSDRVVVRDGESHERVTAGFVNPSLFDVLQVPPLRGRALEPTDLRENAGNAVLISEALWRSQFASREDIVGQPLEVQGRTRTVVGVMPAGFAFPSSAQLWLPFETSATMAPRDAHWLPAIARLAPGSSLAAARAELMSLSAAIAAREPATNERVRATAVPAGEFYGGTLRAQSLLFLAGAVLLLLLVCADVANLQWARATQRQREMGVRSALGATPGRLVRQLLIESVLLAAAGAALGGWLAQLGTRALLATLPGEQPFWLRLELDAGVLLVSGAVALLAAVVFGVGPALAASRPELARLLAEGGAASGDGPRAMRLRHALVALEVAVSVMLLTCAGLLAQSFVRLGAERDLLDRSPVTVARLSLPRSGYETAAKRESYFSTLLSDLAALPGVEHVATAAILPFDAATNFRSVRADDRGDPRRFEGVSANLTHVSADYFRALDIPLRAGRAFTSDDRGGSPPVAIVSASLAERLYPGGRAVGRRIYHDSADDPLTWVTIVGVVPDRVSSTEAIQSRDLVYRPWEQGSWWSADRWLVLRAAGGRELPLSAVRERVAALDRSVPLTGVQPFARFIDDGLSRERLLAGVGAAFAAAGLVVALLGLYGVLAYATARRTREIGIRMALGADRSAVLRLVLGGTSRSVALGLAVGAAAALFAVRPLAGMLFATSPFDLFTWASVFALVLAASLAASWLPAHRATRIDPAIALRQD